MYIATATSKKYLDPFYQTFQSLIDQGRPRDNETFTQAAKIVGARFASPLAREFLAAMCLANRYETMNPRVARLILQEAMRA